MVCARMRREPALAECRRPPLDLLVDRHRLRRPRRLAERVAVRDHQLEPLAALLRQQTRRAAEQVRDRLEVAALECSATGGAEVVGGAARERARVVVDVAELYAIAVGL